MVELLVCLVHKNCFFFIGARHQHQETQRLGTVRQEVQCAPSSSMHASLQVGPLLRKIVAIGAVIGDEAAHTQVSLKIWASFGPGDKLALDTAAIRHQHGKWKPDRSEGWMSLEAPCPEVTCGDWEALVLSCVAVLPPPLPPAPPPSSQERHCRCRSRNHHHY